MFRKVAIAGATAAVILGAGTAALAASGSSGTGTAGTPSTGSSTSSSANSTATPAKGGLGRFARRHPAIAALLKHHAAHGQIVTDDNGKYVTHDGIVGTVSAVSPTSITITSGDGFTQTYSITSSTKVRVPTAGKSATIGDVHDGGKVGVVGTATSATSAPVATYIVVEA